MRRIRQPPITPPMMEVSFGLGVVPSASSSASAGVLVCADEDSVVVGDKTVGDDVGVDKLAVVVVVVVTEALGLLDWSSFFIHCALPFSSSLQENPNGQHASPHCSSSMSSSSREVLMGALGNLAGSCWDMSQTMGRIVSQSTLAGQHRMVVSPAREMQRLSLGQVRLLLAVQVSRAEREEGGDGGGRACVVVVVVDMVRDQAKRALRREAMVGRRCENVGLWW
jgi:hypothetical protein